jgi:aspartyl-tRNA(Asn)/glutamyl-tRNA(Gln) amidotransferase subunit C
MDKEEISSTFEYEKNSAMQVNDEIVNRVASLAKLSFEGEAHEAIKSDLNEILGMCESLEAVNTSNVEPLIFLSNEYNSLRPDTSADAVSKEEALKNAPERDSDYFKVPKVFNR